MLLQFAVIFCALTAMYLLNCAKSAQAQTSRPTPTARDATFLGRARLKLTDFSFTNKWGKVSFALAIMFILANLVVSYLRTVHH